MRASVYLNKSEIREYIKLKGYQTKTIRKILVSDFGYKNSKQISEGITNLSKTVLDIRICYKNQDEYRDILLKMSTIIKYLEQEKNEDIARGAGFVRVFGRDVIYLSLVSNKYSLTYHHIERIKNTQTLYYHTESSVFRREFIQEVNEKIGLYGIKMSI